MYTQWVTSAHMCGRVVARKPFAVVRQKLLRGRATAHICRMRKVLYSIENKHVVRILANSEGTLLASFLARVEHSIQFWILIRPGFLPSPAREDSRANCRLVSRMLLIIGTL